MSAEHLQAHLRQVSVCHQPIFIIGSPRSGTTILAQALAKHSELWFSLESNILHTLFGNGEVDKALERAIKRPQRTWLVQEGVDRDEFLGFLGLGINALYTNRSQGRRWIDKTPIYTLMADVLAAMFPDAFFVHILRDGRRVVQSMAHFLNRFNIDHVADVLDADMEERAFILPWGINFRGACRTWSLYANTAMDFCARHPTRCLTVINEELVADPQKGFRDIFDFVGVPPEEAPVDLFQGRRVNSSFSQPSTKPLSINELSEPWNEWTLDQKDVFLREAGQTLQKYGFVTQDELRQMESEVNSTSPVHQVQRKVVKTAPSRAKSEEAAPGSRLSYPKLVERIREVVVSTAPTNATVLVVSKGEATLTRLIGRQAWHFPQDEDGKYSGYYPADSQDAIAHLEALRAKGADFLLFPNTAFWWLDHYPEFNQHLDRHYRRACNDETCIIYQLVEDAPLSISPADDNKVLIRRLVEQVYNKGNMAILDEIFAANVAHRDPFPTNASGRDAITQGIARLPRAFPDLNITVEAVVTEGDTVAYRASYYRTHARPFLSRPPTRRPIIFTALNMARILEGQIVEHWTMIDRRELIEQLGARGTDSKAEL